MAKELDPTLSGASENTDTENQEEEVVVNPNEELIEQIAARRRDELRKEGFNLPDDAKADEPESKDDKQPKEPEPETTPKAPPEPEEELIKITVYGEDREVPLSEIMDAGKRQLQKESAVEKRMRELAEREKLINEREASLSQVDVKPDTAQDQGDVAISDEEIAAIVSDIQYGTEEQGVAATKKLLTAVNRPTATTQQALTPHDVERIVEHRAIRTRFAKDFKEITKDERLYQMATNKVQQLLQDGEPDEWSTYEKAGKEIHDWYFRNAPPTSTGNGDGDESGLKKKREKKTEIEDVSGTGASDASIGASTPAMPTPDSRSAIIQAEIEAKRRALNS